MAKTIIENIFSDHLVQGTCEPGEFVECSIDLLMVHEMLGDQITRIAKEAGLKKIWDVDKVVAILDHWVPASSEKVARIHQEYRNFVKSFGIKHDLGMTKGICHVAVPDSGFVTPGMFVVGSDSHTTSYGALNCFATGIGATDATVVLATGKNWFKVPPSVKMTLEGALGKLVSAKDVALQLLKQFGTSGLDYKALEIHLQHDRSISLPGRFTIANLGVEMGAKSVVFDADAELANWLKSRGIKQGKQVHAGEGASYHSEHAIDLASIEPLVALPHSPSNVRPVKEAGPVEIDQVFIGSCTNGRLEDLQAAVEVLGSHRVHHRTRCIVIPASTETYLEALKLGYIERFVKSGAIVEYPTCGPCMGGHMGLLGPGETCASTSNRNFPGRMGSSDARIYLVSPATAMATAIKGRLTDPREVAG